MANLFGGEERHREVNRVMHAAIARMQSLGAAIFSFDLPEYDALESAVNTAQFEARFVMERYFASLGPDAPVRSFAQLVALKSSAVQKTLEEELREVAGMNSDIYRSAC